MDVFTHPALCVRLEVEINAMQRQVNCQETIRSIIRFVESDVAEGDGCNSKDMIQAIMEDLEYELDLNVLDYSYFNSD